MTDRKEKNWFAQWFNSPYYHILYRHRDESEVRQFIDHLFVKLDLKPGMKVLDLACGRGRHAVYLNQKELEVTGIDLSPDSIEFAKKFENEHLSFHVHDMRNIFKKDKFDLALNLFTSFGYFDKDEDDFKVLKTAESALKPGGLFVLDYMNAEREIAHLVKYEVKKADEIEFEIKRFIEDNFIVKEISFKDRGKKYEFQERVKALTIKDFEMLFSRTSLKIKSIFGNYLLDSYSAQSSPRLIIQAVKS